VRVASCFSDCGLRYRLFVSSPRLAELLREEVPTLVINVEPDELCD
jgi:hypothetical protein